MLEKALNLLRTKGLPTIPDTRLGVLLSYWIGEHKTIPVHVGIFLITFSFRGETPRISVFNEKFQQRILDSDLD